MFEKDKRAFMEERVVAHWWRNLATARKNANRSGISTREFKTQER